MLCVSPYTLFRDLALLPTLFFLLTLFHSSSLMTKSALCFFLMAVVQTEAQEGSL